MRKTRPNEKSSIRVVRKKECYPSDFCKDVVTVCARSSFVGIQGIAANPSSGTLGPQGKIGSRGPQGWYGYRGCQGCSGHQGPQGSVFSTTGQTNTTGPQGFSQVPGVQGENGAQGAQGNQGENNLPGPQGFFGQSGLPGSIGAQSGVQGATGSQGWTGTQGTQGIPGSLPSNSRIMLSIPPGTTGGTTNQDFASMVVGVNFTVLAGSSGFSLLNPAEATIVNNTGNSITVAVTCVFFVSIDDSVPGGPTSADVQFQIAANRNSGGGGTQIDQPLSQTIGTSSSLYVIQALANVDAGNWIQCEVFSSPEPTLSYQYCNIFIEQVS